MDSSKIISLEDVVKKENRYPSEEEALQWALQLCDLVQDQSGVFPLLSSKNIYIENDSHWTTAHPPSTTDPSEALFRLGTVLHYLLTRKPFRISHYLDGPPSIREQNPQISVRLEAIVNRLVQTVRAFRFSTITEYREDLQRLQKELSGDWKIHWACLKGNGARTNSIMNVEFNPVGKTLKEVWKAEIGEIWASPVMAGESILIGSGNGNIYSLDAHTGKVIWNLSLGARIESTACLDENVAYLGNDLGSFFAVNMKNGSLLWKRSLGEYIRSSAFCDRNNVYAGSINPAQKTGMLWALTKSDGAVAWKKALAPVFSSPMVDRGEIVLGSDDERLTCFTATGSEKWRVLLAGKIRSTPVSVRDFIYVGGFGGILYKIRRANGEITWRNSEAGSMYSSPAYGRSFLVCGNNAGMVNFFHISTGKKIGEFATGGPVTASPLVVNQFVLIGSNDGHFYVLDTEARAVCSFDARSPINSSAYYYNGIIYVGSDQGLHALSL